MGRGHADPFSVTVRSGRRAANRSRGRAASLSRDLAAARRNGRRRRHRRVAETVGPDVVHVHIGF